MSDSVLPDPTGSPLSASSDTAVVLSNDVVAGALPLSPFDALGAGTSCRHDTD